jgi:hypothetical protein
MRHRSRGNVPERRSYKTSNSLSELTSVLQLFMATPWLALLPAVTFELVAARRRRVSSWIAAVTCLAYTAHAGARARRLLCSGECSIQMDLVLLYPSLFPIFVVTPGLALRWRRPRPDEPLWRVGKREAVTPAPKSYPRGPSC